MIKVPTVKKGQKMQTNKMPPPKNTVMVGGGGSAPSLTS